MTQPDHPPEPTANDPGFVRIASDDFPGPILVCLSRDALDAAQAASRAHGISWPPLPDGTYPPAPLFTPSEIDELTELCHPATGDPLATPATASAVPAPPSTSAPPAPPPGIPAHAGKGGAGPRGTWDRLTLLRAVVAAKRCLGARVLPKWIWEGKNLDEDPPGKLPPREAWPKAGYRPKETLDAG